MAIQNQGGTERGLDGRRTFLNGISSMNDDMNGEQQQYGFTTVAAWVQKTSIKTQKEKEIACKISLQIRGRCNSQQLYKALSALGKN